MFRWRKTKTDPVAANPNQGVNSIEQAVPADIKDQAEYDKSNGLIDSSDVNGHASKPVTFRKYGGDWMDEVISKETSKGTINHLPGMGKPIKLNDDNSMETIFKEVLKNANYLPPWVELQHEIRDSIGYILAKIQHDDAQDEIRNGIQEVNNKIIKYNKTCPSPFLQKSLVTVENIFIQQEKWK